MILEFAAWRAMPWASGPERKRSRCDGCYAVELNLQILPILAFRHQNCVRATRARLFTLTIQLDALPLGDRIVLTEPKREEAQ